MPFTPKVAEQSSGLEWLAPMIQGLGAAASQGVAAYSNLKDNSAKVNQVKSLTDEAIKTTAIPDEEKSKLAAFLTPTNEELANADLYNKRVGPVAANIVYYQTHGNGAPVDSAAFKMSMADFQSLVAKTASTTEYARLMGQENPTGNLVMQNPAPDASAAASRVIGTPAPSPLDALPGPVDPSRKSPMDFYNDTAANGSDAAIAKESAPVPGSIPGAAAFRSQGGFDPLNPIDSGVQQMQQESSSAVSTVAGSQFDKMFEFVPKEYSPVVEAIRSKVASGLEQGTMTQEDAQDLIYKEKKSLVANMRLDKQMQEMTDLKKSLQDEKDAAAEERARIAAQSKKDAAIIRKQPGAGDGEKDLQKWATIENSIVANQKSFQDKKMETVAQIGEEAYIAKNLEFEQALAQARYYKGEAEKRAKLVPPGNQTPGSFSWNGNGAPAPAAAPKSSKFTIMQ